MRPMNEQCCNGTGCLSVYLFAYLLHDKLEMNVGSATKHGTHDSWWPGAVCFGIDFENRRSPVKVTRL